MSENVSNLPTHKMVWC